MNSRLVGRDRELAELSRLRAAADGGRGAFVLLHGEAGIGKSALAARVTEGAAAAGVPVLAGRAVADEGAPAFWPWLRVLEQGRYLGLSPALLEVGDGPPAAERFLAVERAVRALLAAAEPDGLVIALDDLHWADDASLRLLRHACGELAGARVLVLGTAREVTAPLAALPAHALPLGPLAEADVAAWLAGAHETWPAYVHRVSGGNPLFVRELARVLAQEGRLAEPATELPVPAHVRAMAGYRLERLSPGCRALLGAASAMGEEFDVSILAEAAGSDVGDPLAEAIAAGVIVDDPEVPGRLRFAHALVRQARYDELPRAERIDWHRRIAAALDASKGAHAGELARHRLRAAVDAASRRTAIDACRAAAATADRALAFADAAHWYARAVDLADGGLERAELLLELADAAYADGQVTEALAHCAAAADLAEEAGRTYLVARAALVVRGIDGPPNETIAALCGRARALIGDEESATHARVLAQHAMALAEYGQVEAADALSRRAGAMAERSGDPAALVDAAHARHRLASAPEGVTERLKLGSLLRDLGAVPGRPEAPLWGQLWRIDAAFQVSGLAAVDAEIAALAGLVDRLGWPLARWHLLRTKATRAIAAGDFPEAERLARASLEVAEALQDPTAPGLFYAFIVDVLRQTGRFGEYEPGVSEFGRLPVPIVMAVHGVYCLAAGDTEQARAHLDRLRILLPDLPMDTRWLPTVGLVAEVAAGLGDVEVAEACYQALLPYAGYYIAATNGYLGSVAGVLGRLAATRGDRGAAVRHLTEAEALEQRSGAPGALAGVRLDLARALVARDGPGDRPRGAELAEQCAHTARRLGMAPLLAASTALIAELAGTGAYPPRSPAASARSPASSPTASPTGPSRRSSCSPSGPSRRTCATCSPSSG
ncbi:transcriptional regulator [Phytohabitans houttuyneae]|uniref:Transcriptional regulator n=1 Tax=Phytohabitans houttuyneae TaxID=1076126 RepID=A0A6V8KF81_9ACTN|nr:transcriptional regulator [Phytohabitans houttuyneae]